MNSWFSCCLPNCGNLALCTKQLFSRNSKPICSNCKSANSLGFFFFTLLVQMVELWTKRKFRCDCGNSKFGDFTCKLTADKDLENSENSYNHNFMGSYCTCNRPYPDPEANEQVEMIQCCICEDWFHEDHLGLSSVDEVIYSFNFGKCFCPPKAGILKVVDPIKSYRL